MSYAVDLGVEGWGGRGLPTPTPTPASNLNVVTQSQNGGDKRKIEAEIEGSHLGTVACNCYQTFETKKQQRNKSSR